MNKLLNTMYYERTKKQNYYQDYLKVFKSMLKFADRL